MSRANCPSTPLGIFWDYDNCAIPTGKGVSAVVNQIRQYIARAHPNCGFAKEFVCCCDTKQLPTHISEGLNRSAVTVVHVNACAKNAADDKLQELIAKFVDCYASARPLLVLISGDINFQKSVIGAKRKDINVVLIHGQSCAQELRCLADESHRFDDVLNGVPTLAKCTDLIQPGYLKVKDLPIDVPNQEIHKLLAKLTENCGGKPEQIGNGIAFIRFGCADDAQRAMRRMFRADLNGHKFSVETCTGPDIPDTKSEPKTSLAEKAGTYKSVIVNTNNVQNGWIELWSKQTNEFEYKWFILSDNWLKLFDSSLDAVPVLSLHLTSLVVNVWDNCEFILTSTVDHKSHLLHPVSDTDFNALLTAFSALKLIQNERLDPKFTNANDVDTWKVYKSRTSLCESTVSNACKSIIFGLKSAGVDDLAKYVRKIVIGWNDKSIQGNFIATVEYDPRYTGPLDNEFKPLLVIAHNAYQCSALVSGAKRYISRQANITWLYYSKSQNVNSNDNRIPIANTVPIANTSNSAQNRYKFQERLSVIEGLESGPDECLLTKIGQLVTSWKVKKLNSSHIIQVDRGKTRSQSNKLFVTAVNGKKCQLLVANANHILPLNSGIRWTYFIAPAVLNSDVEISKIWTFRINQNIQYKERTVSQTDECLARVERLSLSGSDSTINRSVRGRRRKRKAKCVREDNLVDVSQDLVDCSDEVLAENSNNVWPTYYDKNALIPENSSNNVLNGNLHDIPSILPCVNWPYSVITGLCVESGANLAKSVRKLIMTWNDCSINGNYIKDAFFDPDQFGAAGNSALVVEATSAETCEALVSAANRHLKPNGGIVWTQCRKPDIWSSNANESTILDQMSATDLPVFETKPVEHLQTSLIDEPVHLNDQPVHIESELEPKVFDPFLTEFSKITGFDIGCDARLATTVRKFITTWNDYSIHGNYIKDVQFDPDHTSVDGNSVLVVEATDAQKCDALISAANRHLKPNDGIVWIYCRKPLNWISNIDKTNVLTQNSTLVTPDLTVLESSALKVVSELAHLDSELAWKFSNRLPNTLNPNLLNITRYSRITGFAVESDADLAKTVRKFTMTWNDRSINGNNITDVQFDPYHNSALVVEATSAQTCQAMVSAANRHLMPSDGIVWTYCRKPLNWISSPKKPKVLTQIPTLVLDPNLPVLESSAPEVPPSIKTEPAHSVNELVQIANQMLNNLNSNLSDFTQRSSKLPDLDVRAPSIDTDTMSFEIEPDELDGDPVQIVSIQMTNNLNPFLPSITRFSNTMFAPKINPLFGRTVQLRSHPTFSTSPRVFGLEPECLALDNSLKDDQKSVIRALDTKFGENFDQKSAKIFENSINDKSIVDSTQEPHTPMPTSLATGAQAVRSISIGTEMALQPNDAIVCANYNIRHETSRKVEPSVRPMAQTIGSNRRLVIYGLNTGHTSDVLLLVRNLIAVLKPNNACPVGADDIIDVSRDPGWQSHDGTGRLIATARSPKKKQLILELAKQLDPNSDIHINDYD